MIKSLKKNKARTLRRKYRSKKSLIATNDRPRLVVYRSNRHIYAQIIDDAQGFTLCSASSMKVDKKFDCASAKEVGLNLGKTALEKGIKTVVFDRNGYRYHGKVKALADGVKEAGIVI